MSQTAPGAGHAADRSRSHAPEILLASFAGLLLEIAYTRAISFKLFYYYTYLVIGLALLGIGAGGVLVAISSRIRKADTDTVLAWSLVCGALSVGLGYLVVAGTGVDTVAIWDYWTTGSIENFLRLVAVCVSVFVSFVAIGIVVATLFARNPDGMGRLYFADLVGAGIACAVVVSLVTSLGAPATILLAGVALAGAALRLTLRMGRKVMSGIAAGVGLALLVGVAWPSVLPEQRTDPAKVALNSDNTIFSSWSPIFRVDVTEVPGDARLLFHDALLGVESSRRHILIVALTVFFEVGLGPITGALIDLPLAVRILTTFLVLAPLGLCLGTFMPLGLRAIADVTEAPSENVAWAWAVNGFASVIGSVLSTILAMTFGFQAVMGIALVAYLGALVALRGLLRAAQVSVIARAAVPTAVPGAMASVPEPVG